MVYILIVFFELCGLIRVLSLLKDMYDGRAWREEAFAEGEATGCHT